jgi:two-component system cell cycle response regulator DivK
MYVEDNVVNLDLVRRIVRIGDHELVSFSSGSAALEALQSDLADVVLMDIELEGDLDGIEVVKRLRARGDQRPIIAITAYAMMGDEERILAAGYTDYLPKPLSVTRFLTLLAKYDPATVQPRPAAAFKTLTPSPELAAAPNAGPVQPKLAAQPATEAKTLTPSPELAAAPNTEPAQPRSAAQPVSVTVPPVLNSPSASVPDQATRDQGGD